MRSGCNMARRARVWEAVPVAGLCRKTNMKLLEAGTAHGISHATKTLSRRPSRGRYLLEYMPFYVRRGGVCGYFS